MPLVDSEVHTYLDSIYGSGTPSNWHIGAGTDATTPDNQGGNFTEPVGNAYARISVPNDVTNWPAASNRQKANALELQHPVATGSWGTIAYWGRYGGPTGGTPVEWAALDTPVVITTNDRLVYPAGGIASRIDAG